MYLMVEIFIHFMLISSLYTQLHNHLLLITRVVPPSDRGEGDAVILRFDHRSKLLEDVVNDKFQVVLPLAIQRITIHST